MVKQSNPEKHYSWLMGADMYFATTVILCKQLENSYRTDISAFNRDNLIGKYCGFTTSNPDYEMLIPVVFNFKHAIELYLKSLVMIFEENHEYKEGHNLINLLNHLIDILKSKPDTDKIVNLLNEKVRPIINKYFYGTYAFTDTQDKPDVNNEAERYPEYKNPNCYEVKEIYNKVNNTLVKEIERDCVYLRNTLRDEIYLKLS